MELIDHQIWISKHGERRPITDLGGVDETDTLDEFIASLQEHRESETSGKDYIRTQALVHYAKLSSVIERTVTIHIPEID